MFAMIVLGVGFLVVVGLVVSAIRGGGSHSGGADIYPGSSSSFEAGGFIGGGFGGEGGGFGGVGGGFGGGGDGGCHGG